MSKSKLFKEEFENPAFEDKEIKKGPPLRRRQSIYAGGEADGNEKYTSGASPDGADISIFAALPATEKDEHIRELWSKCILKSKSAAVLKRAFSDLECRIIKYGSSKNV